MYSVFIDLIIDSDKIKISPLLYFSSYHKPPQFAAYWWWWCFPNRFITKLLNFLIYIVQIKYIYNGKKFNNFANVWDYLVYLYV